jgi:hypothetical protein
MTQNTHSDRLTVKETINTSILQLNEYRESLITTAITCQIDVEREIELPVTNSTPDGSNVIIEHSGVLINGGHNKI